MRLSINLDDDLYAVARSLAREGGTSVSAAVNLLLRRLLEATPTSPGTTDRTGLPVVPGTQVITSDDVYRVDQESA